MFYFFEALNEYFFLLVFDKSKCRSSGTRLRLNRCFLCLLSPVLHTMLCGSFTESRGRFINLHDVDESMFLMMLDLWCGKECRLDQNIGRLLELGMLADRFQVAEVVSVIEDAIMDQMSVSVCVDVLSQGRGGWLERAESAARKLAVERFQEVASTSSLLRIPEEILASLLEEDGLNVETEEFAFEAVVRWMKARDMESVQGAGLLSKIRFPHMDSTYLRTRVREELGGLSVGGIGALIEEAIGAKAAFGSGFNARLLGPKATAPRKNAGVRWSKYKDEAGGGGQRQDGRAGNVVAVAVLEGQVCCASMDGSIGVWNRATMQEDRRLRAEGAGFVCSLAAWEGRIVSGHCDGRLRVWSAAMGACEQVLEGHSDSVRALSVLGRRLVSGSADQSIRVWAVGADAAWACERALVGHAGGVWSLTTWRPGGTALSGSADGTVRAWDVGTGALDATLAGHHGGVCGLAVDGDRVFSASTDGTVRAWAAGEWAPLRTVYEYAGGGGEYPLRLVVCGGKLVAGSSGASRCEVRPEHCSGSSACVPSCPKKPDYPEANQLLKPSRPLSSAPPPQP